ncbi:hypothetical protein [Flavobacterium sp.]|uniref:hypothetical protein n=1 Tax=Flavobacterium sp. TaxID=239 RepID=UPI0039E65529
MKTLKMLPILGCVLFLTTASTCHNDDDDSSKHWDDNRNQSQNLIAQSMQQGNWRITYYFDTDSDETSRFSSYTFSFGSDNVLTASNGSNTYTGSWSITDSHSSDDDNPHSDLDFNIAFSNPAAFAELTDDWDIVTQTASKIELIDISGGNGGTDHLIFEKN